MTGAWFGSQAARNPCVTSTNERPLLHCPYPMPVVDCCCHEVVVTCCHVLAPSVVCQSVTPSPWHCVSGEPTLESHPSRSLTNETSAFVDEGGRARCCQVFP